MALWFKDRKTLSPRYSAYAIIMQPGACARLIEVLQAVVESNSARAFEYIGNSPHYQSPFTLRYVDTGTLKMSMEQGGNYRYAGLYATVLLVRPRHLKKAWSILKTGWRNSCYRYKGYLAIKQRIGVFLVRCLSLFGRQRLGRWLFVNLIEQSSGVVAGKVTLRKRNKALPANMWDNVTPLEFEGVAYQAPKSLRIYYERMISANLEKFFSESSVRGTAIDTEAKALESSCVSYSDFIKRNGLTKGFYRMRRLIYIFNTYPRRIRKRFDQAFAKMKFQVAKASLENSLLPAKDELMALYDSEGPSSEELADRLDEYLIAITLFSKPHLLVFDDELAYIVMRILRTRGEDELAKKMKKPKKKKK
jgi:hypothetical protein